MSANSAEELRKRLEALGIKWVMSDGKERPPALNLYLIEETSIPGHGWFRTNRIANQSLD